MRSQAAVKVGLVLILGLLVVFALTDTLAAHDAHVAPRAAAVRVFFQHCGLDPHTHLVNATGTVVNGTQTTVESFGFSVSFTDAGGDEEDEPVPVAAVAAGGRLAFRVQSKSPFPSVGVHCALANLNAPGNL